MHFKKWIKILNWSLQAYPHLVWKGVRGFERGILDKKTCLYEWDIEVQIHKIHVEFSETRLLSLGSLVVWQWQ